jgi:hypothetical protein
MAGNGAIEPVNEPVEQDDCESCAKVLMGQERNSEQANGEASQRGAIGRNTLGGEPDPDPIERWIDQAA